jgi:hypothetical protein
MMRTDAEAIGVCLAVVIATAGVGAVLVNCAAAWFL